MTRRDFYVFFYYKSVGTQHHTRLFQFLLDLKPESPQWETMSLPLDRSPNDGVVCIGDGRQCVREAI
jgi:hypothetical protein